MCREDLAFFGRISAGISHDIKNTLAVIKEQAGLISDFVFMAEKGRPLDLARVKDLARRINDRVEATDDVVKRLNYFAHTVDDPYRVFDVNEMVVILINMTRRFAARRRVELEAVPAGFQAQLTGDPFLIMHLTFAVLERAIAGVAEGGRVAAKVTPGDGCIRIIITPAAPGAESDEGISLLLAQTGADLAARDEGAVITLPLEPGADPNVNSPTGDEKKG
jgi:hypothetical protein